MLLWSRLVVGSSSARMPQLTQKVSARASRITTLACTEGEGQRQTRQKVEPNRVVVWLLWLQSNSKHRSDTSVATKGGEQNPNDFTTSQLLVIDGSTETRNDAVNRKQELISSQRPKTKDQTSRMSTPIPSTHKSRVVYIESALTSPEWHDIIFVTPRRSRSE